MPNNPLRKNIDKKTKIQAVIIGIFVIILIALVAADVIFGGPLTTFASNTEVITEAVERSGPLGPIIYIAIQAFQTVVAPIPGTVTGPISGFLFGWWGILWGTLGSFLGAFIVFLLTRRFGRPFVEKLFKKSSIEKFDFITQKHGRLALFVIFLLPGFPDDMVCYLAGLTKIPIEQLLAIFIIGRLPAIIGNNIIGMGLSSGSYSLLSISLVFSAIVLAIFAWKREAIMKYLQELDK